MQGRIEELRIDVLERQLPTILLPGADDGYSLLENQPMTFDPSVDDRLPVTYRWTVDGQTVSTNKSNTSAGSPGALCGGARRRTRTGRIGSNLRSRFIGRRSAVRLGVRGQEYNMSAGRTIRLEPVSLTNAGDAVFQWSDQRRTGAAELRSHWCYARRSGDYDRGRHD
ncbi:MAG: PKD-like domain-containing protein [Alistipes sp.]